MHRRPRPRIVVPQATQMTSRQAAIANTALTMGVMSGSNRWIFGHQLI
jgi:hypothetical protein